MVPRGDRRYHAYGYFFLPTYWHIMNSVGTRRYCVVLIFCQFIGNNWFWNWCSLRLYRAHGCFGASRIGSGRSGYFSPLKVHSHTNSNTNLHKVVYFIPAECLQYCKQWILRMNCKKYWLSKWVSVWKFCWNTFLEPPLCTHWPQFMIVKSCIQSVTEQNLGKRCSIFSITYKMGIPLFLPSSQCPAGR